MELGPTYSLFHHQVIEIGIELTVNHLGYFLFHLCPLPEVLSLEEEECFEKYPLPLADGSGYKYQVPSNDTGYYNTTVRLPAGLKCRYVNNTNVSTVHV
jgi:hypothetical protein